MEHLYTSSNHAKSDCLIIIRTCSTYKLKNNGQILYYSCVDDFGVTGISSDVPHIR